MTKPIFTRIALILCFATSLAACEDTSSPAAPKKPVDPYAADSKSCESYETKDCPSRCYKYTKVGGSAERCYQSKESCSDMVGPANCAALRESQCTFLAASNKCIDQSYDSCSTRTSSDCTQTLRGQKCALTASGCMDFSRCESIPVTDCNSVNGCKKAYEQNRTEICTDTNNANELLKKYDQNGVITNSSAASNVLPAVISSLGNIAQAFILRNTPGATFVMGGGIPATAPSVDASGRQVTTYGAQNPAALALGNSLNLDVATQNPILANLLGRTSNPSECDKITEPAACDSKYSEGCGYISNSCRSLEGLSKEDLCKGVAANGSSEVASKEARDRCSLYSNHCKLASNENSCEAK